MRALYAAGSTAERAHLAESLVGAINGLLTLMLGPPPATAPSFDGLLDLLEEVLDRAIEAPDCRHDADATRRLIAALTHTRERPLRGFLEDLSEILFLPRKQRSEYTSNRHAASPYKVRKLLLEYAVFSRQMDELVGAISKAYCARRCEKLPVGCCHILGYDLGLVPEVMLELQRLEALRNGWTPPQQEDHCRYHSPSGCVIGLFKSPACVGYLCEPLTSHLRATRGGAELNRFLNDLSVFNNCDLDRRKIFEAMQATIAAGNALLKAT